MAIGFERVRNIHASVVNAAGYRLGTQIEGGRNYSGKQKEVVASGIILPDNAPKEFGDIAILCQSWQMAEEKFNQNTRADQKIRTAKELITALPRELSHEQQERLIRDYAAKIADTGHAVIWSIHDKIDGNPHAHILISPRKIVKGGNQHGKASPSNTGSRAINPINDRNQSAVQNRHIASSNSPLCDLPKLALDSTPEAPDLLLSSDRRSIVEKRRQREIKPRLVRSMVAAELINCWAKNKRKTAYKLDPNGNKIPIIDPVTGQQKIGERGRKMWKRENIEQNELDQNDWRLAQEERWEQKCNAALAAAGIEARISMAQRDKRGQLHFGDPGRKGQIHLGQMDAAREASGEKTWAGDINRQIRQLNQEITATADQITVKQQEPVTAYTINPGDLFGGPPSSDPQENKDNDSYTFDFGMIDGFNDNRVVLGPQPNTTSLTFESIQTPPIPIVEPNPAPATAENVLTKTILGPKEEPAGAEPPKETVLAITISEKKESSDTKPSEEKPIELAKPISSPPAEENVPTETTLRLQKEPTGTDRQKKTVPVATIPKPPKPVAAKPVPPPSPEPPKPGKPVEPQFIDIVNDGISNYNHYMLDNKHYLRHIKFNGDLDPWVAANERRIASMQPGFLEPKEKPAPPPAVVIEPPKPESPAPAQVKPAPAKPIEPPKPTPAPIKPAEPQKSLGTQIPAAAKKSPDEAARPLQYPPAGKIVTSKPQPAPIKPQTPTSEKHRKIAASAAIYDNGLNKFLVLRPAEAAERKRYAPYVVPIVRRNGSMVLGKFMDLCKAEKALADAKILCSTPLSLPLGFPPKEDSVSEKLLREWKLDFLAADIMQLHEIQKMIAEIAADNARQAYNAARHIEGRDLGPGM